MSLYFQGCFLVHLTVIALDFYWIPIKHFQWCQLLFLFLGEDRIQWQDLANSGIISRMGEILDAQQGFLFGLGFGDVCLNLWANESSKYLVVSNWMIKVIRYSACEYLNICKKNLLNLFSFQNCQWDILHFLNL